jgi:hypothetical protein
MTSENDHDSRRACRIAFCIPVPVPDKFLINHPCSMVWPRLVLAVVVSAVTICHGDELRQTSRKLKYKLAGFEPTFLITDEVSSHVSKNVAAV